MDDNSSEVDKLLCQKNWHIERKHLRALLLECGLMENVKWGKLCYSVANSNAVIIYGLKSYCALGFFKGALFADDGSILVSPGKHSQAMRQLRFTSLDEITNNEACIKGFVEQAVQVEKQGLEVDFLERDNLTYPEELEVVLGQNVALAEAFDGLTPGRRRGYVLYFSDAKKSKTRASRIEKHQLRIMDGLGLHDR